MADQAEHGPDVPALPQAPRRLLFGDRETFFLAGGFLFLLVSLVGFVVLGISLYTISQSEMQIGTANSKAALSSGVVVAQTVQSYIGPLVLFFSALTCAFFGSRLLRAGGLTSAPVISAQDMVILGPAVSQANSDAITQWIRLNSLTGWVGFFTKIGLTGLPLATIVLTILLSLLGLVNTECFELAKLTLGAFLGSFVQRQAESFRHAPGQ